MSADEGKKYIVSECKLDEPQLLEKRRNFISICRIICVDLPYVLNGEIARCLRVDRRVVVAGPCCSSEAQFA